MNRYEEKDAYVDESTATNDELSHESGEILPNFQRPGFLSKLQMIFQRLISLQYILSYLALLVLAVCLAIFNDSYVSVYKYKTTSFRRTISTSVSTPSDSVNDQIVDRPENVFEEMIQRPSIESHLIYVPLYINFFIALLFLHVILSFGSFFLLKFLNSRAYGNETFIVLLLKVHQHLSMMVVLFFSLIAVNYWDYDFLIISTFGLKIKFSEILMTFLIADFLFGVSFGVETLLKKSFNQLSYADRMLKVLRHLYLIRLCVRILRHCERNKGALDSETAYLKGFPSEQILNKKGRESVKKNFIELFFSKETRVNTDELKLYVVKNFDFVLRNSMKKAGFNHKIRPASRSAYSATSSIPSLSKHGMFNLQNFDACFPSKEYFKNLCDNLNIPHNVGIGEKALFNTILRKAIYEIQHINQSKAQMERCISSFRNALYLISFILASLFVYANAFKNPPVQITLLSALFGAEVAYRKNFKDAIDNLVFIFCIHPFDVGDRVFFDNNNLIVKEMRIFSTKFQKFDGTAVYISNSQLSKKFISNVRRSKKMSESVVLHIDIRTKRKLINTLQNVVQNFLIENNNKFEETFMFNYDTISENNKLQLKMFITHKDNFQDYNEYLNRKHKFMMFLYEAMKDLRIDYNLPVQKIKILNKEN